MTSPLISILIPVYNGADYLRATLKSILSSTEQNFEVIIVDDLSTDHSVEIIREFSAHDPRIKMILRESKGGHASAGITYGLPYCTGEYFFYMSQDDMISADCLEKCVRKAQETGAEVVASDMALYYGVKQDCEIRSVANGDYQKILSPREAFLNSLLTKISSYPLRKMSLVKQVGYEDTYYDSCDFSMMKQYYFANKVALCDGVFYSRQNNSNAITQKLSPTRYTSLYTFNSVLEFMVQNHFTTKEIEPVAKIYFYFWRYFKRHIGQIKAAKRGEVLKIYKDTWRDFKKITWHCGLVSLWLKMNWRMFRYSIKRIFYHSEVEYGQTVKRFLFFTFRGKKLPYVENGILKLAPPRVTHVGKYSYAGKNMVVVNPEETSIGSFVSIGTNVQLGHDNHPTGYLSTSPYFYFNRLGFKLPNIPEHSEFDNLAPITIGSDVWIGDNVHVKNGVHIGIGAIVGAGSLVTKNVPPYAIVAGVPARIIRYRFEPEMIAQLLESRWWELPDDLIRQIPYEDPQKALNYLEEIRKNR